MRSPLPRILYLLLALALPAAMVNADPDATDTNGITRKPNGELTINLRDADIRAFITAVAETTGKNFVVDPRVKGNVTVISAAPADPKALYDIFLSILKVHGFAAIPSGDVIKIVPDATAKQEGQDTGASYVARDNDALVTAVIPVHHVNAPELVAVLRPLLPQEAHLAGFAASNVLLVADSGVNVRRIMKVVAQLDTESNKSIELYVLRHGDAEELSKVMATLVTDPAKAQAGQPAASSAQFIPYDRANTIIIQAAPSEIVSYRHLLDSLDVPDRGPDGVEVIPLRYATAIDLLPVLQGILSGEGGGVGANSVVTASGGDSGAGGTTSKRSSRRDRRQRGGAAAAGSAGGGRGMGGTGGDSGIQADEATNTLIVQASPRDLKMLKDVIAKLDVRRNQVLVEGIIAELTTQRGAELGIQWKSNVPTNGTVNGTNLPGAISGGINGLVKDSAMTLLNGYTFGYMRNGDITALLRAFASDRYTNVLSTPTLMTLDNAEAEIVVGQNVPFVTGKFTTNTANSANQPFETIERKDVGILLKVRPQINEGGTVTLDLEQEVSSVDASTQGSDLITNKRAIKTTVLVDNNDIVVLGGLLQNGLTENSQKVPWVGDIPFFGQLFKNHRNDHTKTNLMVFLRPTIVSDREGNHATAISRYDELRQSQDAEEPRRRGELLREDAPRLPPADGLLE